MTARIEAERERELTIRLNRNGKTNPPIGKVILDTTGCVIKINRAMCAFLGYSAEELTGKDFRRCIAPSDLDSGEADLTALVGGSVKLVASERRYLRRDGTIVWLQRNAVLAPGVHGAPDVVIAHFQDVGSRRRAEAELAQQAVTDPLTGLPNRYALVDHVDACRAARPNAPLGVIFIDLDGLKRINDAHGHAAGDAVLVHAASCLAQALPRRATAYRLGGDEFVVLEPNSSTLADTAQLAERIRRGINGIHDTDATAVTLTASVGCAWGPRREVDELLRAADANMYREKTGRQRTG